MKRSRLYLIIVLALAVPAVQGCGHRLVARGDQQKVRVFPDEGTYQKVKELKTQSGPFGVLGGLSEKLVGTEVDNNTPVRIVSSDSQGDQVEVTDGPNKGLKGFVAKENVN